MEVMSGQFFTMNADRPADTRLRGINACLKARRLSIGSLDRYKASNFPLSHEEFSSICLTLIIPILLWLLLHHLPCYPSATKSRDLNQIAGFAEVSRCSDGRQVRSRNFLLPRFLDPSSIFGSDFVASINSPREYQRTRKDQWHQGNKLLALRRSVDHHCRASNNSFISFAAVAITCTALFVIILLVLSPLQGYGKHFQRLFSYTESAQDTCHQILASRHHFKLFAVILIRPLSATPKHHFGIGDYIRCHFRVGTTATTDSLNPDRVKMDHPMKSTREPDLVLDVQPLARPWMLDPPDIVNSSSCWATELASGHLEGVAEMPGMSTGPYQPPNRMAPLPPSTDISCGNVFSTRGNTTLLSTIPDMPLIRPVNPASKRTLKKKISTLFNRSFRPTTTPMISLQGTIRDPSGTTQHCFNARRIRNPAMEKAILEAGFILPDYSAGRDGMRTISQSEENLADIGNIHSGVAGLGSEQPVTGPLVSPIEPESTGYYLSPNSSQSLPAGQFSSYGRNQHAAPDTHSIDEGRYASQYINYGYDADSPPFSGIDAAFDTSDGSDADGTPLSGALQGFDRSDSGNVEYFPPNYQGRPVIDGHVYPSSASKVASRTGAGKSQGSESDANRHDYKTSNTTGRDCNTSSSSTLDLSSTSRATVAGGQKKSKQKGRVMSRIFGTTEPSLDALNLLTKQTFADANVSRSDPNSAARLKVSTKTLPPEAPNPASREPKIKRKRDSSKPEKPPDISGELALQRERETSRALSSSSLGARQFPSLPRNLNANESYDNKSPENGSNFSDDWSSGSLRRPHTNESSLSYTANSEMTTSPTYHSRASTLAPMKVRSLPSTPNVRPTSVRFARTPSRRARPSSRKNSLPQASANRNMDAIRQPRLSEKTADDWEDEVTEDENPKSYNRSQDSLADGTNFQKDNFSTEAEKSLADLPNAYLDLMIADDAETNRGINSSNTLRKPIPEIESLGNSSGTRNEMQTGYVDRKLEDSRNQHKRLVHVGHGYEITRSDPPTILKSKAGKKQTKKGGFFGRFLKK